MSRVEEEPRHRLDNAKTQSMALSPRHLTF